MNKIRKSLSICMILCMVFLTGCDSEKYDYSEMKKIYNCIDSVVDYSIKAPLSTEENKYKIYFNAPFYRVYSGEDKALDWLSNQYTFEIGNEVQLTGENVEMLNGATVTMNKMKLLDCIDYDDYCQRMAYHFGIEYLDKGLEEDIDAEVLESIQEIVSNVGDDYTVISVGISFYGCIYNDVVIDSLRIESLGFEFEFEDFSISTIDFEDGMIEDDNNIVIDYTAGSAGMFVDAALSNMGYIEIIGDVKRNIENIEVSSLDDDITIITADNYSEYKELEEIYGPLYENNPIKYEKDETISATYTYIRNASVDGVDAKMSNIFIGYTVEDGTTVGKFVYQPTIVDGSYLIMEMLAEYIE